MIAPISDWIGSSATCEWYTEQAVIQRVITALNGIDLDPCSNPPPYNVPATLHMSRHDNGLTQRWHGKVYMNPPYGRGGQLPTWLNKLAHELATGRVPEAITLVPARTETAWFKILWDANALCFWQGRMHFTGEQSTGHNAPFPSVLAYFGPNQQRFTDAFRDAGKVIYP